MTQRNTVTVRVPATTANLGPGYDVLGMALSIWMDVTVERASEFSMVLEGEGANDVKADKDNLIVQSCELAFKTANQEIPTLRYTVTSKIPFGCGCGSSSAAAVAGFMAGMSLTGLTLPTKREEALLQQIGDLEGHPDNAAPAIYGGIQMGFKDKGVYTTQRVPTPNGIICVLFVPDIKMKENTHATRGLVPTTTSLEDAVHNMSKTSLLILALSTNQPQLMKLCMEDRFHQQQRAKALFPHMNGTIQAAMDNGADFAFLSGAGPTICAFVSGRKGDLLLQPEEERVCDNVAKAMIRAAKEAGIPGHAVVTNPSDIGAHFVGTTEAEGVKYVSF